MKLIFRGSGAGTLGVPLGGTRRVGGLLGVAGQRILLGLRSFFWVFCMTLHDVIFFALTIC